MTDHPMQPSDAQLRQWCEWNVSVDRSETFWRHLARTAYAAGADAQLDRAAEWLHGRHGAVAAAALREDMRPKPPSLAEQALAILDDSCLNAAHENCIRRALERLAELEAAG